MSDREKYAPGPAGRAWVKKEGEQWTLVLVRELRHPPDRVWQALTDPAHLREWAPFDADGSLGTAGSTVKLTTVGAPTPMVSETTVKQAEAARLLEYNWGGQEIRWELEPLSRRHPPDALAQHRPRLHRMGRRGLAHLLRRARSDARRSAHRAHRRPRGHGVRRLAAIEDEYAKQFGVASPGKPSNAPSL